MQTFRYYLDIDAKDRDDAQEQLEDMAGGMSFGDLNLMELPDEEDKQTATQLKEFFKIKNNDEILKKIEPLFSGWDGWCCLVEDCLHVCGCDTGDMFDHLLTHTKEELEETLQND